MSEILLEDIGPNGNIQAIVESTAQATYFYLHGAVETDFGVRSVWVRNHGAAPDVLDVAAMQAGEPPANPAPYCRHPQGLPQLERDKLFVIWLPEGNGAALYDEQQPLAIIPPWSGTEEFHGYASECLGEGPVAWELTEDNVLFDRFRAARDYWRQWEGGQVWREVQSTLMRDAESQLGTHSNYYAIDGGCWPPKAILRIPRDACTVFVTVGVCVRPQPNVEMYSEDPELLRRVELGVALPSHWPADAERRVAAYLSGQSNLPWDQYSWLGPGHTVPCDAWCNRQFTYALLQHDHPALPPVSLSAQFGDPVQILWFLPITEAEREIAIEQGSQQLASQLPATRWQEA